MKGSGSVAIDGVTYTAFQNSRDKTWSVYVGTTCTGRKVCSGILARTQKQAIAKWLESMDSSRNNKN